VAEKFDPRNIDRLETPERLVELPPADVVRLLRLGGAETIVDYGAGSGVYTIPVAEAVPHGRVIAVEAYAELLERLEGRLSADLRPRVTLVQTETNTVPLADGAADRVLMINVLHHIRDEPDALDEVARLLAPGGLLVSIDFGQMDRPVGPPNDHVLSTQEARAVVAGLGLREVEIHEPGTRLRYHLAIVAERP
jgi:ubiquinone/menaquinone biosynthesis C-methylase UbiE